MSVQAGKRQVTNDIGNCLIGIYKKKFWINSEKLRADWNLASLVNFWFTSSDFGKRYITKAGPGEVWEYAPRAGEG